jgi:hypothetical protein
MVLVGMLAAASLMWQYWGILSGREHYDDGTRQPLLDSEMQVGVSDRFKWSPGGGGGGGGKAMTPRGGGLGHKAPPT